MRGRRKASPVLPGQGGGAGRDPAAPLPVPFSRMGREVCFQDSSLQVPGFSRWFGCLGMPLDAFHRERSLPEIWEMGTNAKVEKHIAGRLRIQMCQGIQEWLFPFTIVVVGLFLQPEH